jgi:hypothetical protein
MSRITTRIFLGLSLLAALAVLWFSVSGRSAEIAAHGATAAAALAVITAVIAAWGAQRVVELEEDKQRPYAFPRFDVSSRYGLVLFRVENTGGSTAHNIEIAWDKPLTNSKGKEICFSASDDTIQIPVLHSGESISKTIDGHVEFFQQDRQHVYTGKVTFTDASGRKYSHKFRLDAEVYRETPSYDEEALKTHFELQKIPDQLRKLERELKQIHGAIDGLKDEADT